jgi:cysteine desulfurase/selenocysteine lyase
MVTPDWLHAIRDDFPALGNRRNGAPPIYFDNACTTLVPQPVIEAISEYYYHFPACGGGRSRHWFAREVGDRIEGNAERGIKGARQLIREFLNARSEQEIVFTLNTTHALNLVACGFPFHPGDVVLLSDKEHNSNLLPWLRLERQGRIRVDYVGEDEDGGFNFAAFERKLQRGNVRLASLACTSNITGYTLPAREIVAIAHRYGALVLLDAAQTAPHRVIDVQELDVDLLAFSLHKMCGPKGVGVLYGKQALFDAGEVTGNSAAPRIEPLALGGGTVVDSAYHDYELLPAPEGFEAGIQNYPAQIAAGAAITYLRQVGFDRIREHVGNLSRFLTQQLLARYGDTGWFRILGPADPGRREGVLTFAIRRPNCVGLVEELDQRHNIMIRDGAFCANAYLNHRFGRGWTRPRLPAEHRMTYRVSLYFYNTVEECEVFLQAVDEIFRERSYL